MFVQQDIMLVKQDFTHYCKWCTVNCCHHVSWWWWYWINYVFIL